VLYFNILDRLFEREMLTGRAPHPLIIANGKNNNQGQKRSRTRPDFIGLRLPLVAKLQEVSDQISGK